MKIIQSKKFQEVKIFYPKIYKDDRGFFMESFNHHIKNELKEYTFYQDNHSKSKKGVIRGLHYQWSNPMGKLLRVPVGSGIDVIIDIRKDSFTYGQWESFELSDKNNAILWVPPGFAQGFLSLQDNTHLCYRTTALHSEEYSSAIHPLESGLDIDWTLSNKDIILSEKDKNAQSFNEYKLNPKF